MSGKGGHNVLHCDAKLLGFHDKFFDLTAQQLGAFRTSSLGQSGYDGADSGLGFEQAGGDKRGHYFVSGVGIDFEFLAESPHRGKRIATANLAGDDGFLGGVDDLLVDGDAGPEVDAEGNHDVYYNR